MVQLGRGRKEGGWQEEESTRKYLGAVSLGAQEPGPWSGVGKGWW